MNLSSLEYLGLTPGETIVYTTLLEQGELAVADIIQSSGLKKGDCYNKLYNLVERGLIEEFEHEKKKHYRLLDPRKLEETAASQYHTAIKAKQEIENLLPDILSTYTLTYHRPGIMFFEGEEAMRRILEDNLTASGETLQYVDTETAINKYPEINAAYVQKRNRLNKAKRVLTPDSPINRTYGQSQLSPNFNIRYLPTGIRLQNVSMSLYDNKISYLTLKADQMVGVIIEDPLITAMHKQLFELNWANATS